MLDKIHPFIFNWPGQYENCLKLEEQLTSVFGRVTVINSDDNNKKDSWHNIGNEMYFTGQWNKALELFDGEIMFHTQADAYCENLSGLVNSAIENQTKYNWGVYEPNFDRCDIQGAELFTMDQQGDRNIKMVVNTDCTIWLIHKDVISEAQENYTTFFSNLKFGWGICQLYASTSYKMGRPVIKDYNFTAHHPDNTGYNQDEAGLEKALVIREMRRKSLIIDRQMALYKAIDILKNNAEQHKTQI
jgi:hypothetical protein